MVQVADDALDLDMPPPADHQHVIAFRDEEPCGLVDSLDQRTRRVDEALASGHQPLPLPVADPMGGDQDSRRLRQRIAPLRLAAHREPARLELRLDDLVVDELPVNRHRGRLFNTVDHRSASRTPKQMPITSARITRMIPPLPPGGVPAVHQGKDCGNPWSQQ